MEEKEIKIRNLNWGDRELITSLINEIADSGEFADIKTAIVYNAAKAKDDDFTEEAAFNAIVPLAEKTFSIIRERCLPKLKPWLLDLTGLSEEEFNKTMPFDADVQIVNQILSQKGFSGFFSGASLLLSRIKESAKQFIAKLPK